MPKDAVVSGLLGLPLGSIQLRAPSSSRCTRLPYFSKLKTAYRGGVLDSKCLCC